MKTAKRTAKVSGGLVALLLAAGLVLYHNPRPARGQTGKPCCGPDQVGPREIDFPYYSLRDGFGSTLLLVSDSPQPTDLTIAIRSLMGQTLLTSAAIQPQDRLSIDLKPLITQLGGDVTGPFADGSVSVYFTGTIMPVVGQITMTNPSQSLIHESEMVENDPGRSDIPAILSGLWWNLSGGRDANIMVSNMSGSSAVADVYLDFQGERHTSAPLNFIPHETKVLSVTQLLGNLNASPSEAPEGGITIIPRGPTPTLIAQGKVLDKATGFSTTLSFPDPDVQVASVLHASGVPIGAPTKGSPYHNAGNFTPRVVARNLLSSAQNVTITAEYPGANGTEQIALAPLSVGPYATVDQSLDYVLSELPAPVPYCSIRIEYSGPPGSVVAQVSSVEEKSNMVVDARVANEGNGWVGSGANPWHLDDQTESVVFLTNMSAEGARIAFDVQANGVHYYLTKLSLAPHETRAIDLRQLRDAQQPDFKGNRIPAAATDGSVFWMRLDEVPVMGRVVVMQRNQGVASNYDCCTCICPANYVSCAITPGPPSCLGPHAIMQCTCMGDYQNCNGATSYSDVTPYATWTTDNSTVATFDSTTKGLLRAHAAGSANMKAAYTGTAFHPTCQPPPCHTPCITNSVPSSYSCPINVTNSGCPDHLVVYEIEPDTTPTCPTGDYGWYARRVIPYEIVDANDMPVSNVYIQEFWYNWMSNTCGNGTPQITQCALRSGSTFGDGMYTGCNTVGGSCGFSIALQQWQTCTLGYAPVILATIDSVIVHDTSVSVSIAGHTYTWPPDTGKIPEGTNVYP